MNLIYIQLDGKSSGIILKFWENIIIMSNFFSIFVKQNNLLTYYETFIYE